MSQTGQPPHLVFVPHTHWDREWYYPQEVFARYLEEMMRPLLELLEADGEYPAFVLDGQAVMVEDFLAWHPEQREAVKKLARGKRLRVGPWYTQPDEFIPRGESLVRNLLMGKTLCDEIGDRLPVGYCPDAFGHTGQLPQILKGFAIDHAVFSRGIGDEPRSTEYRWRGPDGTEILATCQLFAYSNAGHIPDDLDEASRRVALEVEKLGPFCRTKYVLLNQGGDHHRAQPLLPALLKRLGSSGEYGGVVAGDFETYSGLVKKESLHDAPLLTGSLRGSRFYPVLCGVLSTRRDLKIRNEKAETLLLCWAEPAAALAGLFTALDMRAPLREAWRLLLQNHAHDTICGCCVDDVAREARVRYDKVCQIGALLTKDALERLGAALTVPEPPEPGERPWLVVNSLAFTRTEPVRLTVCENAESPSHPFVVRNRRHEPVASQVVEVREREGAFPGPSRTRVRETTLVFTAENVPALGTDVYFLSSGRGSGGEMSTAGEPVIENEFFRVSAGEDGTFTLEDLRTGTSFSGLGLFEDEGDGGDTYNFSPVLGERVLKAPLRGITREVLEPGPVQKTLRMKGALELPQGLAEGRAARTASTVLCPVVMQVSLFRKVPRVDVVLEVDNQALDHRLRIVFPLGAVRTAAYTDEAFDVVAVQPLPSGNDWIEKPCGVRPMGSFVDLAAGERSLAVAARGVREMEIRGGDRGTEVALTLLRSVGWLSREDVLYRRVEAGPKIPAPEAQCTGSHTFHLALIPHGQAEEAIIPHYAQAHGVGLEAFAVSSHAGKLDTGISFIELAPDELVLSALKRKESGDSLVLRCWNPTGRSLQGRIRTALPLRSMRRLSLAEEPAGEPTPFGAPFDVGPHEIMTFELIPEEQQ